jgi:PAS domain-containing protein
MLPTVRLYIDGPDDAALRAIRHLRALADGAWANRCAWEVCDAHDAPVAAPPGLPALALHTGADVRWLAADPAAGIPPQWLDHPGGGSLAPADVAAPPWPAAGAALREVLGAAPHGCGVFSRDGFLLYANAAFRNHYGLAAGAALGRPPSEWGREAGVRELRTALAAPGGRMLSPGAPTLCWLATAAGERLSVVHLGPTTERTAADLAAAFELLERIRQTNHSIGNALVGILGYAELLQREIAGQAPAVAGRVNAIITAAQRVDGSSQEISAAIADFKRGRNPTP